MPKAKPKMAKLSDAPEAVQQEKYLYNDLDDLGIPTVEKPIILAEKEIPKMETVLFLNNRDPGVPLYFHYHSKTHPLKQYTLMHGMKYTLPIEIIKHLEGDNPNDPWSCHTRQYSRRMREDGVSETYASSYVPNFQLKSVRA